MEARSNKVDILMQINNDSCEKSLTTAEEQKRQGTTHAQEGKAEMLFSHKMVRYSY